MIRPVNIDPGVRASQLIRPAAPVMRGAPKMSTQFMTQDGGVKETGAEVYNRMNELGDAKVKRAEYLEDQARIRRQKVKDDVIRRNQEVEDINVRREEKLADDERDYQRNAYKRLDEKERNKIFYKKAKLERREYNQRAKQTKADQLLRLQQDYSKLLNDEFQGISSSESLSMIKERRKDLDVERRLNKEGLVRKIMASVADVIAVDEDDDSIDRLNTIVSSMFGQTKTWENLTPEDQAKVANQLALLSHNGGLADFGSIQEKVGLHVQSAKDEQIRINESLEVYDKLLVDARSRQLSPEGVSGLKAAIENQILSLGGNIDMYQKPTDQAPDSSEDSSEEGRVKPKQNKFDDEFLSEAERKNFEINQSKENIEELKSNDSMTGKAITAGKKLVDAVSNSGVGVGDVVEAAYENPGLTTAAVLAANEARKKIPEMKSKVSNSFVGNEGLKKRLLERVKTTQFADPKDYDNFLKKNYLPEYNKPMPTQTGKAGKDLKNWMQWKQGYMDHVDVEIKNRSKSLFTRIKSFYKGRTGAAKIFKGAGIVAGVAEVVNILGDLQKAYGKVDPELQAEYDNLRKLQDEHRMMLEKQKEEGQMLMEAAQGGDDTAPITEGNTDE